jgi:DNA repair exonuclease SbcCD ATPase subunit
VRFQQITVSGFRAFGEKFVLDLDSDAVLIYGGNGTGKTSIFDSIQWCLYGEVERFKGRDFKGASPIRNVFVDQIPVVELDIADGNGRKYRIQRSGEGSLSESLSLQEDGITFRGKDAQSVIEHIMPQYLFESIVYLGQERITKFIDLKPRDRYDIVSNIFGLKAIGEFYGSISNQINLLVSRQKEIEAEKDIINARITQTEENLRNEVNTILSRIGQEPAENTLDTLRERVSGIIGQAAIITNVQMPTFRLEESSIKEDLDNFENLLIGIDRRKAQISTDRNNLVKMADSVNYLLSQNVSVPEKKATFARLTNEIREKRNDEERLKKEKESLSRTLKALERDAAVFSKETFEIVDLLRKSLGQLSHDTCPVCGQAIHPEDIRRDVQNRIQNIDHHIVEIDSQIGDRKERIRQLELGIISLENEISNKTHSTAELEVAISGYDSQLRHIRLQVGLTNEEISSNDLLQHISDQIKSNDDLSVVLDSARREVEQTALILRYLDRKALLASESKSVPELRSQLHSVEEKLGEIYGLTQELRQIEKASRNAEMETVIEASNRYGSLISSNYKRLDSHPLFKNLKIRTQELKGAGGEIYFDVQYKEISANVHSVLSQSQQNSVALCLFLTFNLAKKNRANPIVLDDPVLSMDEVNILALVDLLKKIQKTRQIIIATHNERFYAILTERLKPTESSESQIRHVLKSFNESGPDIETRKFLFENIPTNLEQYVLLT